ncbi:Sugar (pentulose and hexulose) kinase [Gaiella occulta]|uniref:Sugar (Pentulose and hexulose) kinase n=1 Tax=Gaiella occulta TaxID=1002870 RepID=A0A7M2Z083_9ACTN|nr:FGGY family carbohydrate kinase [Gaiella occulta]RDI75818.1 Sugar (pentulose and hexulose) kinase [Gaiella occulta]
MSEAVRSGIAAGVDVATQGVRVACVDERGRTVASAAVALPPPRRPAPGWAEQDARAWWPAAAEALRRATGALGPDRGRIVAVAAATTSGTVVLADSAGEPVGPALLYDDRRAAVEAERAQELGRERWEALGLRIGPSFTIAKLAWLARRGALVGVAHAWGESDLVVARLLGEPPPTDWSHALKSGYDLLRREWPSEVYEALGVPARLLPRVQPPASLAGRVCAAAARETGLPEGCEVRLGMTDGCAAQLAGGAVSPGRFVSVLGTTLVIKGATRELVRDPAGVVYSHLHPDGWWLPGGASNTGGEALAARYAGADLAALDRAAAARGPAACLSYPLVRSGERFPFLAPTAEGFVVGEPVDEVEAYRAALEGVAFLERLAYDHLSALGASPEGPIATAGGASRSRVWNRIRATVLGRPLAVPASPTSAFGAALLAAAGTMHENLTAAAAAMVEIREEVAPEEREEAALRESYARFVEELRGRGWLGGTAVREPATSAI